MGKVILMTSGALLASVVILSPLSTAKADDGIRLNAYVDMRFKYEDQRKNRSSMNGGLFGMALNANRDKNHFYAEIEYKKTPELDLEKGEIEKESSSDESEIEVTAVWLKHTKSEKIKITAGKFFTPLSFHHQRRFSVLQTSIHEPEGAHEIPDNAMLGIQLDGRFNDSSLDWRYFLGVCQDWKSTVNSDDENNNKPIFGRIETRPWFWPELAFAVGAMKGVDARHGYDEDEDAWLSADKTLYAVDFNIEDDRLFVEGVYHYVNVRPESDASLTDHEVGAHILARYDATEWISPWAMYEFASVQDEDEKELTRAYSVGLNFSITDYLKLKTEGMFEHQEEDEGDGPEKKIARSIEIAFVGFF